MAHTALVMRVKAIRNVPNEQVVHEAVYGDHRSAYGDPHITTAINLAPFQIPFPTTGFWNDFDAPNYLSDASVRDAEFAHRHPVNRDQIEVPVKS